MRTYRFESGSEISKQELHTDARRFWSFCKHPLPENVYNTYIQYWATLNLRLEASLAHRAKRLKEKVKAVLSEESQHIHK